MLADVDVFEKASFESWGFGRCEADVFTDKFFILRIFLFGEWARSNAGSVGKEIEKLSFCSMVSCPPTECVLNDLNGETGNEEFGDSGDELGEGSVSEEESNVDIVVVGEDSVDSKVDAEPRRIVGDEK